MELGLKDKRALVLGASKGLGRAVACELVNEGARVAICARNAAVLERTASEIGTAWFVCDLSVPGAATRLVAGARALGAPDIVLINSGGPPTAPFDQLTVDQWRSAFDNLFMSAVEIVNAVLPSMRAKKWGRILFATSIAAKEPTRHRSSRSGHPASQPARQTAPFVRTRKNGLVRALSRQRLARRGLPGKMADDDLVCPPPVSARDHPARGLAVCPIHTQLSRRRRSAR